MNCRLLSNQELSKRRPYGLVMSKVDHRVSIESRTASYQANVVGRHQDGPRYASFAKVLKESRRCGPVHHLRLDQQTSRAAL